MNTQAWKRILDAQSEWDVVCQMLPAGWREKAKELGAMRRTRGIVDPEVLLRILLVHLADGCSLKETALRAEQAGWANITAVGLFKRLRRCERWLTWIAGQLRGPAGPSDGRYRPLAVDATTISESGQTGSQWRVHWSVNLVSLHCEFFELTDIHGGEKFGRFPIVKDDLVLGDRGYSNPPGVEHVRSAGGHVLVRQHPATLPTYPRADGQRIDVLKKLRGLAVGSIRSWAAWVKGPSGQWYQGRTVAVRRSRAAALREIRRLREIASSQQRHLSKGTRAMAHYVLVWTSLRASELSDREVLAYYRHRWQLELVFKRAKSIMGLGQLPKKSDASSRAWLSGKLLVAMLVEKLWKLAESFSPWGYVLDDAPQPLA